MNHFHKKIVYSPSKNKQKNTDNNDKRVHSRIKIKKKDSLVIFFLNLAADFEMSYLKKCIRKFF